MIRTSPSRPARHRLALAGLAFALGLTACTADDEAGKATESTPPPSAATDPSRALTSAGLPDPTVGVTGIGWLEGTGAFASVALADTDIGAWPELLAALPASDEAPFAVTTAVERDPDACTLWRVLVTDVSLGDSDAGSRMRTAVLDVLAGVDHDPGPLLGPDEEPWCGDLPREGLAWYAAAVTPAYCATPDADPLLCLTVTSMRYDGGAHPNTVHTDLVLDSTSGDVIDAVELLAARGLELDAATAFVESTVCDLDLAAGRIGEGDGCWQVLLRNARPTPSGLVLSFAPYESGPYAFGPRDLFIPWVELDAGAVVPAAARAAQRELRIALASSDWSQVEVLVPADGRFLVATSEESTDPVARLAALPRDPRPEMLAALAQGPGTVEGMTVWPELAVRDPFAIDAAERQALASAFGTEAVAAWESAGRYLGWRAGFDADGTWRFIVAGD